MAVKWGLGRYAEDLAQDVIVQMLERQGKHSLVRYILIDCIRDRFGQEKSGKPYRMEFERMSEAGEINVEEVGFDPTSQMDARMDVVKILPLLPERVSEIAKLSYFDGYSGVDISRLYKLSPARVGQILAEGFANVRRMGI